MTGWLLLTILLFAILIWCIYLITRYRKQIKDQAESFKDFDKLMGFKKLYGDAKNEITTHSDRIKMLEEKLNGFDKLTGIETEYEKARSEMVSQTEKITIFEEKIKDSQTLIYGLSNRITELTRLKDISEKQFEKTTLELSNERSKLEKYAPIIDLEVYVEKLKLGIFESNERIQEIESVKADLENQIKVLKDEIAPLELEKIVREFGLYEVKYDFGSSLEYRLKLDEVRQKQKNLIKNGSAVTCDINWTVDGSSARGRRMVGQVMRLMTWAFNSETESLILRTKFDNVTAIRERIMALFERINKLDAETNTHITSDFLLLKVQELEIYHEYQEKKQLEAEEQREIREQMREEERAQRELEKAQSDALKEEQRYFLALEKARKEVEFAVGEKQLRLETEIERLGIALAEAQARRERALSMAEQTRIGHVYVISNIGSFGEGVYKIGMTRRLEPLERVRELSNASVPFRFDVHAVIFSQDAPSLERQLHQAFADKRVNKINLQKEFFRVSLEEIRTFVESHHGQISFTLVAEAADYRKTVVMSA